MIEVRITAGRWRRLHPGVFVIGGSPASWRRSLTAACLATNGVVSHRAAAALWNLPGFEATTVEVAVRRGRRRRRPDVVEHETADLVRADVTHTDGIRVTTPGRTLIDLGSLLKSDVLEEALNDALRRRITSLGRIRRRLDGVARNGKPGIVLLRSLLAARSGPDPAPESVLETKVLRALRAARLPRPALQHVVAHDGKFVARLDFAYPELRLAVEAEGYRWHTGKARWKRHIARESALAAVGWSVVRITWDDLGYREAELMEEIAGAIRVRATGAKPGATNARRAGWRAATAGSAGTTRTSK